MKILLKDIIIRERQRVDLGDCTSLAESLRETGQIQPIGVNERNELIWGRRRLEAATILGWPDIEAIQRTGLTAEMEQEIEYEEDARRKDRTWQEKCLAIAKLKRLKENRTGENWTVRRMADFTGFSKSSVGYMMQIADALAVVPKDEAVWACENYLDAIKLLLARTHKQVNEELERRRGLFMAAALPPKQAEPQDPAQPISTEQTVQQLDKTPEAVTVWLHGKAIPFHEESLDELVEGRAMCVIGFNPSLKTIPLVRYVLSEQGFAVFFFSSLDDYNIFDCAIEEFQVQPHPLVWNKVTNAESAWPFSSNYMLGIVITKSTPNKAACRSSVISAAQSNAGQLPPALVEAVLSAVCPENMPVYCVGGVPPAAVAATGRTPIWYEPDPATYDAYREDLVAYYQETVPSVVIKERGA